MKGKKLAAKIMLGLLLATPYGFAEANSIGTVTVDGEEYLAGAYMSSGSSSASIQSAAASGFGGTELIINEDGILDQMLNVYQTYSGLVASAV